MGDINYLLLNMERAVQLNCGRKPSGRPLLLFPSGKVRIEFLGTFDNEHDAANRVRQIIAHFDSKTGETASPLG